MSELRIDRITLTLDGVPASIANAAIEGLDAELTRRLSVRGLDVAALRDLSSTLRLPPIETGAAVNAETLRGLIADGLIAVLSPPRLPATDWEAG
jgi:hypothetical protein